jgi:hypothetical protein
MEGRPIMARTSKAESNLEDHREKPRIVEGDQVLWAYVGVIGGVIHAGRIAAGSNGGESTSVGGFRRDRRKYWDRPCLVVGVGAVSRFGMRESKREGRSCSCGGLTGNSPSPSLQLPQRWQNTTGMPSESNVQVVSSTLPRIPGGNRDVQDKFHPQ